MAVDRRTGQPSKGGRRGRVFAVRVTEAERASLEALQRAGDGPRSLGPWLVWRALAGSPGTTRSSASPGRVVPGQALERVVPGLAAGGVVPVQAGGVVPPPAARTILDLCAGSGAWSEPYARAGYVVQRVTLPGADVRTFVPPVGVWGVLAAPPCTEFSLAKNGHATWEERDHVEAMACVNACLRIVLQCRPAWWALENPTGYLSKFLGVPRDVWEPCDFGDPWTKRTALWGNFALPRRGPFVEPTGSAMQRASAAERAVTPPGFARAFFEANQ